MKRTNGNNSGVKKSMGKAWLYPFNSLHGPLGLTSSEGGFQPPLRLLPPRVTITASLECMHRPCQTHVAVGNDKSIPKNHLPRQSRRASCTGPNYWVHTHS